MNRLFTVLFFTVIVVTSLTWGLGTLHADRESAVIEKYNGSSNLPDWVAFYTFLNLVKGQVGHPQMATHYMARAFDLDPNTKEGASKIDYYHSWFVATSSEINRELASESNRILCSGDWASMSHEEIQSGLDENESMRERLNAEHFALTLDRLSAEERTAFLAHIENVKLATSHVKLDNVLYWGEEAEEQARLVQASICSNALTTGQ